MLVLLLLPPKLQKYLGRLKTKLLLMGLRKPGTRGSLQQDVSRCLLSSLCCGTEEEAFTGVLETFQASPASHERKVDLRFELGLGLAVDGILNLQEGCSDQQQKRKTHLLDTGTTQLLHTFHRWNGSDQESGHSSYCGPMKTNVAAGPSQLRPTELQGDHSKKPH